MTVVFLAWGHGKSMAAKFMDPFCTAGGKPVIRTVSQHKYHRLIRRLFIRIICSIESVNFRNNDLFIHMFHTFLLLLQQPEPLLLPVRINPFANVCKLRISFLYYLIRAGISIGQV